MLKPVLFSALLLLPASPGFAAGKVQVELYVMSHCPFGTQAENALFPVIKNYADLTDLKVGFIGESNAGPDGKPNFTSMHGPVEVDDNVLQICALAQAPDKWLDYILERNRNINALEWQPAAKAAGLDPAVMGGCVHDGTGLEKYAANLELAKARNASASPTIYIGGAVYSGPRTKEGFEWEICSAIKKGGAALPASCAKALAGPKPQGGPGGGGDCGPGGGSGAGTAPVAFGIKVVTDKDCAFCAPPLLDDVKKFHPAAKVELLDSSSPEGIALIAKHNLRALPAYVLDKAVEREGNFKGSLENFYSASSGAYVLKPGPKTFAPLIQPARRKDPGHLDVFVEALSPEAAQAAGDLMAFLTSYPGKAGDLTLSWHLVTQEAPEAAAAPAAPSGSKKMTLGGVKTRLTSSRGEAEVSESLRQACLFQYEDFSVFMTYLNCRYYNLADMSRSWQCYKPAGKVKECIEGAEGEKLLRADARFSQELEVKAPALLWENRYGPFPWGAVSLNELTDGTK